jgi:hypothetical protein
MKIPGFTARASLSAQQGRYGAGFPASAGGVARRMVYPQLDRCGGGYMALCLPILLPCAYAWCWWSSFWGRGSCRSCMNSCIDAHLYPPELGSICKDCATSWPCA